MYRYFKVYTKKSVCVYWNFFFCSRTQITTLNCARPRARAQGAVYGAALPLFLVRRPVCPFLCFEHTGSSTCARRVWLKTNAPRFSFLPTPYAVRKRALATLCAAAAPATPGVGARASHAVVFCTRRCLRRLLLAQSCLCPARALPQLGLMMATAARTVVLMTLVAALATVSQATQVLVAGGYLSSEDPAQGSIAQWDGASWTALGEGVSSTVRALDVNNGSLVAAGEFASVGATPAGCVGSWNNRTWSAMGTGVTGVPPVVVYAIAVHQGSVVVGGHFTTAGDKVVNYIARWDGATWSGFGSGLDNICAALTVHNGALVAGGGFRTADGVAVRNVAVWDGVAWSALGAGPEGYVYALVSFNGMLLAGGSMPGSIEQWTGISWTTMGSGFSGGEVRTLAVIHDELYAGGYFDAAGIQKTRGVARWNGTTWLGLGPGLGTPDRRTLAMVGYNGHLVAGGDFESAGEVAVNKIAQWDGVAWSPVGQGFPGVVHTLATYDSEPTK